MSKTILAVVDDMIFKSKIRAAAEQLDVEVKFPRSKESAIAAVDESPPKLIVADLQNQKLDTLELARELKADEKKREIVLVGFFSHVEIQLRNDAQAAGYDRVMPRSEFFANLAKILTGQ